MEFYKVYWCQKVGLLPAEVGSPVSISFLYLWTCYWRGFSYISEAFCPAQQKTFSWCLVFVYVCSGLNVARLFWILLVFEVFLTILGTPPCFLLLVQPIRLLDMFRLLTICAKTSISLLNPSLLSNKFCANTWHFHANLSMFFRGLGFLLLCLFYVFFLSYCFKFVCLVVFRLFLLFGLCFCAGCIIGTCAINPAG